MLTYDALIGQARIRGMPITKMRGILREYLQILILKELYAAGSGSKLYFTGGTYLRLAHNIKRFSEDLDFNTNKMAIKEFESLLRKIKDVLNRSGIECKATFAHFGNLYVSKLAFGAIEKYYEIVSPYSKKGGIIIKVETNNLKRKIKYETQMISGFGEMCPCVCTDRGVLFADKIDALIKKNRGRHIYDIMFMLSNKYRIDRNFLKRLGIREDPLKTIAGRIKSLTKDELKKQAQGLRPFLFDEKEARLIINAQSVIPSLLEQYAHDGRVSQSLRKFTI